MLDRHAAKAAFLAAGQAIGAPQRAASAVTWAGLALLPLVVLAGADEGSWLPGLRPVVTWFQTELHVWPDQGLGAGRTTGTMELLGDPRLLAVSLALLGSVAGIVSAQRHRAVLARGFAAAGHGFLTRRLGGAAPLMLLLVSLRPADGVLLAPNALALWLMAHLAAGSLTALAERRTAGLGGRGVPASGWDMATLVASLSGMLLVLAHILGILK